MNAELLDALKVIAAKETETDAILSDPRRVLAFLSDLARDVPKPQKTALVKCLEHKSAEILKNASEKERANIKQKLAQRINEEEGIDPKLCSEAVDLLCAVLFGEEEAASESSRAAVHLTEAARPQNSAADWYVGVNDQGQGPFTKAKLGEMLKAKEITRESPVWKQGWLTGWMPIETVTELRDILAKLPPPLKMAAPSETLPSLPRGMVYIKGGTFTMGSPENEPERDDDEVQHQVTVSSFYMGKYQVTQKEYEAVIGWNPSTFGKNPNNPVELVSWYEAVEYCNKLSEIDGLTPAYTIKRKNVTWNQNANGYRLPTEAEWEYACRAGTTTAFNTGAVISYDTGWYNNSDDKTHPVGQKAANAWGLYDMHGNVCEWCWDWYDYYSNEAQTDPQGPSTGAARVVRGGAWDVSARGVRSACRSNKKPSSCDDDIGFRLVRSPIPNS